MLQSMNIDNFAHAHLKVPTKKSQFTIYQGYDFLHKFDVKRFMSIKCIENAPRNSFTFQVIRQDFLVLTFYIHIQCVTFQLSSYTEGEVFYFGTICTAQGISTSSNQKYEQLLKYQVQFPILYFKLKPMIKSFRYRSRPSHLHVQVPNSTGTDVHPNKIGTPNLKKKFIPQGSSNSTMFYLNLFQKELVWSPDKMLLCQASSVHHNNCFIYEPSILIQILS